MRLLWLLTGLAMATPATAATWSVARSEHFEVWSDAGAETARLLDHGLERLHTFFVRQIGVNPRGTVRVICFASMHDFADYRTRSGAAGFSLTTPDRQYIVVTGTGRPDLRIPAHEYAHLLIHSSGWTLPGWIAEGISEVVSSVQIGERYSFIGGDLPGRSHLLKSGPWMSPADLFAFDLKEAPPDPSREALFYSESWALAEMLMVSPAYAPRLTALLAMLARGSTSQAAIEGVYRTSIDVVFRDLRDRLARGPAPMPLPGIPDAAASASTAVRMEVATSVASRAMLADLRHAGGDFDRAEAMYRALEAERPAAPEFPAALGLIALERHDPARAMEEWRKAIALGIPDAGLCFHYALLADDRSLGADTIRAALDRAVALRPDFDDAHFKLALMDKNEGRSAAAVGHLRAMRVPGPDRAWPYYSTLSDALLDSGDRTAARQAAIEARRHAASDRDRAHATQLVYMADTELSVEMATDAEGRKQFRTVRVPVNAPPRNPFIEAGDDAKSTEARLDQVECADNGIHVTVSTSRGPLTLSLPDPTRVQIRNGGGEKFEFICGPQQGRTVLVEYSASGVLRGLELR